MSTEEFSKKQESFLKQQLSRELSLRGISGIGVESESVKRIDIPAVPVKPATLAGKEEEFIRATENTLKELGLPLEVNSSVYKMTVSFKENSPLRFDGKEKLPRVEKLDLFMFDKPSNSLEDVKPGPIVLFSHGGKIHESVIEASGYLTMINAAVPDARIVTVNHRGSHNHKEKADSSFDTRETDILVALQVAQEKLTKGLNWDGRVILMGDSMGGHVVASLSGKLDVNGIILTEPAAYGAEAQSVFWVYPDSKFPSGDKHQEHLIGDPLFSAKPEYLKAAGIPEEEVRDGGLDPTQITGVLQRTSPDNSPAFEGINEFVSRNKDGRVLLITMDKDTIIPDKVTEGFRKAATSGRKEALVEIKTPGGHGSTTAEEVMGIAEFLK